MKYKTALLALAFLIATAGKSFGMLQVEDTDTSDVRSSQPFNFNEPEAVRYSAAGLDRHKRWRHWCVVHKAGLGIVTAGGVTFLTGALVFATAPGSEQHAEFFPTGQALTGLGLEVLALLETIAGAPLLIGGSIHDQKKWRYGFVGPKGGVGVAYSF
jgi:hypothetical protein